MSFLDQLKKQADALQAQQRSTTADLERNTALVEAASKSAFTYLLDLSKQLNVLSLTSNRRYALDTRVTLDGLRMEDFQFDSRRKTLRDQEVFDHLVLSWRLCSGQAMSLSKNFPPDVERLESRLRISGAEYEREEVRDPDSGKLLEIRFDFKADLLASVRVDPNHDEGMVRFRVTNVDPFESATVDFPAHAVTQQLLDDLAKLIVGQPSQFLLSGQPVRAAARPG